MQNIQSKEKTLLKVRGAALFFLFTLLVLGVGLIGYGAAIKNIVYLIDGAIVLVTSPLFLFLAVFAKRSLTKQIGV